jgi:hypothetical protein
MFSRLLNLTSRFTGFRKTKDPAQKIWGPSFGFSAEHIQMVCFAYEESQLLSEVLGLSRNPEDYWLARFMCREGTLGFVTTTSVTCHVKERSSIKAMRRYGENVSNGRKIDRFLKTNSYIGGSE